MLAGLVPPPQFDDVTVRNTVAEDLLELGIYTTYRYPPLHKVPLFATGVELPGTDEAEAITLLLPLHQSLTDAEVERVASSLISVLDRRSGQDVQLLHRRAQFRNCSLPMMPILVTPSRCALAITIATTL